MYSVGHATVTKDPIIVNNPGCTTVYEIPQILNLVPENIPAAVPYKGGVMMIGLSPSNGNANYWLPGDAKWSSAMGFNWKREGMAVSLRGNTEVVAMMNRQDDGTVSDSITYYDGTTIARDEWDSIPEKTFKATLVEGADNNSFYVFGGEVLPDQKPNVYKFDMGSEQWTQMGDMPLGGGAYPSCGKATWLNRLSVICMGTETNNNSNDIEIFDLLAETWSTKANVLTPANPPTYGSLVFSRGSKLYRVRGFYTNGDPTNSYDVLNVDTLTWEPPVQLDSSDVTIRQLVLIDTTE